MFYKLVSSLSREKTLEIIEKAVTEFDIFTPNMFGFIGRINWDQENFWIVNQSSMYQTRRGYRFRTYRRFEGRVLESNKTVVVEGEFKTRPLFRISILMYMLFFIVLGILGGIFATSIVDKVKIILISGLMMLFGIGIMKFNIYKTQESEAEIIEFVEGIIR